MGDLIIKQRTNGIVFTVKAVPAGSSTAIIGMLDGMLKVKLSAPPQKGKANQCLVNFLADKLEVKKNTVSIISGQANPIKQIQILDMTAEMLLKKLGLD